MIQHILTLTIIISFVFALEYQTLLFENGQMHEESNIIIYDDVNSEHATILSDFMLYTKNQFTFSNIWFVCYTRLACMFSVVV